MQMRDEIIYKLSLIAPKLESLAALLKWQKQESDGLENLYGLGIILQDLAHEVHGLRKLLDDSLRS